MNVHLPTSLRRLTGGVAVVSESATTVAELIDRLDARYPGMAAKICGPDGDVLRHIRVFVNGTEIRELAGRATPLTESDNVVIAAAMAGG